MLVQNVGRSKIDNALTPNTNNTETFQLYYILAEYILYATPSGTTYLLYLTK